jgi:hypothetical protein
MRAGAPVILAEGIGSVVTLGCSSCRHSAGVDGPVYPPALDVGVVVAATVMPMTPGRDRCGRKEQARGEKEHRKDTLRSHFL